jgi:hypothetical protein
VAAHLKERRLAIIIDNDNRYSAGGHSMRIRGEQRAGTRDHNRREHSNSIYIRCSTQERSRSCTLGRTPEHSRHSPVRHNSHNPVRRRRRWTLCHRSPRQQLVRLRDRDPNHPATLELVKVLPRQRHRWWQRSLTPILLFSSLMPFEFPQLQPAGPAIVSRQHRL